MTLRPFCRRTRRCLPVAALLAALLGAVTAGCIIIPTPENLLLEGRGVIEEKEQARFVPGESRREDVLLHFGEPDLIADEGRVLAYHWARASAWVFIGAYPGGAVMPLARHHFLVIEFDAAGLLRRHEFLDKLPESLRGEVGRRAMLARADRQIMVVNPVPAWPDEAGLAASRDGSHRLAIGEFLRSGTAAADPDYLGQVKSFGIVIADVRSSRPVSEVLRAALAAELAGWGYFPVVPEEAEILVTGDVVDFRIATPMRKSLSLDVVASLDVHLRFSCTGSSRELFARRFEATAKIGPAEPVTEAELQYVTSTCLEMLQRQLREDAELAALLAAGPGLCP